MEAPSDFICLAVSLDKNLDIIPSTTNGKCFLETAFMVLTNLAVIPHCFCLVGQHQLFQWGFTSLISEMKRAAEGHGFWYYAFFELHSKCCCNMCGILSTTALGTVPVMCTLDRSALLFPLAAMCIISECWAMTALRWCLSACAPKSFHYHYFCYGPADVMAFGFTNNHSRSFMARTSLIFADVSADWEVFSVVPAICPAQHCFGFLLY